VGYGLDFGVTGKVVVQNLDGHSDAVLAGDTGLLYRNPGGFSAGVSTTNRQSQLAGYNLPVDLRMGAAYGFDRALRVPLTLTSDLNFDRTRRFYTQWMGGAEWRPFTRPNRSLCSSLMSAAAQHWLLVANIELVHLPSAGQLSAAPPSSPERRP